VLENARRWADHSMGAHPLHLFPLSLPHDIYIAPQTKHAQTALSRRRTHVPKDDPRTKAHASCTVRIMLVQCKFTQPPGRRRPRPLSFPASHNPLLPTVHSPRDMRVERRAVMSAEVATARSPGFTLDPPHPIVAHVATAGRQIRSRVLFAGVVWYTVSTLSGCLTCNLAAIFA
jgi:hypothetical protein